MSEPTDRGDVTALLEAVARVVEHRGRAQAIGAVALALGQLLRELPHQQRGEAMATVKDALAQEAWGTLR